MSDERASGELEGSTLGSSSRDGEGSRTSRRTHTSGSFLLDSAFLPRSKSLRHVEQRPRRSEPEPKEKRERPESEIVVPKKKSRFPWSRKKDPAAGSAKVSSSVPSEAGNGGQDFTDRGQQQQQSAVADGPPATVPETQPPVGLDRDSMQIVNLALNLSESRRMGSLGRSASARVSGSGWTPPGHLESQPPATGGFAIDNSHPRRNLTQSYGDDRTKGMGWPHPNPPPAAPSPVLTLLPRSVDSNPLPHGVSDNTLARAGKTRKHFELFAEYLRLLPSLPPLKSSGMDTTADARLGGDDKPGSGREYNPLQSIRNRKVRFRQRCPIDPASQGWHDVERVREWIDSIEIQYRGQIHSPFECLNLPHFKQGPSDMCREEVYEEDNFPVSPPSSLRRASRTSSVKARRPRLDWEISPAELIADAAWLEDGKNKSKAVDNEGNNLYPDPTALFSSDANLEPPHLYEPLPNKRVSLDAEQPASHASLSDGYNRLSTEFKPVGRGRRRHRIHSPTGFIHGRSRSGRGTGSRRHKLRKSRSSSSLSSTRDDRPYWAVTGEDVNSPRRSTSASGRLPDAPGSDPYQAGKTKGRHRRDDKSSVSSVPSLDDRYDPLTSWANQEMDPQTPPPMRYFPSIASNLSSPSSRSPSPSKRVLPYPRLKELADDSSLASEGLRKSNVAGTPETHPPRTGRLEPSPIPDRVSTAYQDDRIRPGMHARKGSTQESKLRGIFKGPGKIAEKVGNEVSKMKGGLILKKESSLAHSRQSSFATSFASDDENIPHSIEETRDDRKQEGPIPFPSLRLPPTSEESVDAAKGVRRDHTPSPSPFVSPTRQGEAADEPVFADVDRPSGHDASDAQKKDGESSVRHLNRPGAHPTIPNTDIAFSFVPELHTIREQIRRGHIKDSTIPFSLTRPPITGLAQAKASHSPTPRHRDLTPSGQSRSWSISERSITNTVSSGVPGKREIERSRALLLSSGIKAREITRRAESVRSPPPDFLCKAFGPDVPVPPIIRMHEYDVAVQHLLQNMEQSHDIFQKSVISYPGPGLSSLKSQLSELEDLVNNSLNPRVRAAADNAENLSVQLNTTSTLAVKQLSDTLDKGIRRRHRRLRWIRRTGFVMLEWALVAMLWWVWLIVMIFKGLRGVLRGVVSSIRWVLWL
ncbi:hypothetical protein FE257_008324 [Aspergillus nanangensis]|uniref:Uncharacterized protein n=1 Tax=Aspergillus nanangensis TaxID=2582783 RepID=A0AAD4GSQ6_ASPNN|nr:hypothetical protein FE257_008324 [Aspergillus nanangensis]